MKWLPSIGNEAKIGLDAFPFTQATLNEGEVS